MIEQFQHDLYYLLKENQEIQKHVNNIHLTYQKNSITPFVVIELLKAVNVTSRHIITYELNFSISIFTDNSYGNKSIVISTELQHILTPRQFINKNYKLLSLGIRSISWDIDKQLIINKLNLNYKSIIQQYKR